MWLKYKIKLECINTMVNMTASGELDHWQHLTTPGVVCGEITHTDTHERTDTLAHMCTHKDYWTSVSVGSDNNQLMSFRYLFETQIQIQIQITLLIPRRQFICSLPSPNTRLKRFNTHRQVQMVICNRVQINVHRSVKETKRPTPVCINNQVSKNVRTLI